MSVSPAFTSAAEVWPRWPHRSASTLVAVDHVRFHVQRMGSGPHALLLHGAGAASHSMGPLAERLRTVFSLVVPDLPGHGFSRLAPGFIPSLRRMNRAVRTLVDTLGTTPVELVVGHSAGAALAVQMVLDGAVRPRLLVLMAPAVMPLEGALGVASRGMARALAVWPLSADVIARQAAEAGMVEALLARMGTQLHVDALELYCALARMPLHVDGVLRMLAAWDPTEVSLRLRELKVPVLVLAGEKDRAIPLSQVRQVTSRMPRAVLHIVEQAGHLLHEEQPQRVADHIFSAWDGAAADVAPRRP